MTRLRLHFALRLAAVFCAVIAACLAFGIIDWSTSLANLNRICLGWLAWSVAFTAAAALPSWRNR